MKQKIGIIHTGFVTKDAIQKRIQTLYPNTEIIHVVDDGLLQEVMQEGKLTKSVARRMYTYAMMLEEQGVSVILNQCSSVAEAVDMIRPFLHIDYLKIDEPMAKEAVLLGSRIGLIATVDTTIGPSKRLIESWSSKLQKEVIVTPYLVDGALKKLNETNNIEEHNATVMNVIVAAAKENDVLVLAQGSMHILQEICNNEIAIPVLTSIDSGTRQIGSYLERGSI